MTTPDDGSNYTNPTEEYLQRRLQLMDPYEFEQFVGDVWRELGWNTRVVGEPGDRGIDVIGTQDEKKVLIQAKRYGPNTTVGSPEVQQYASLRLQEDGVNQVIIVTTGAFSRQARDLAPDLSVMLVNGEEFIGMLDELECYGLFADYFDDIEQSKTAAAESGPTQTEDQGVLGTVRSWFS